MSTMLIGALSLVRDYGFAVIPVHLRGKRPLKEGWQNLATSDPDVVTDIWTHSPHANVGVVTGSRFGIVVLDVDVKGGGLESYERFKASHPDGPAKTLTARTGGGRYHVYLREDSLKFPTNAGKIGARPRHPW